MTGQIALANQPADDSRAEAQHRCSNCNGIIVGLADQDLGMGLNVKLGLVSDQCALVCNDCTARLIEARTPEAAPNARTR